MLCSLPFVEFHCSRGSVRRVILLLVGLGLAAGIVTPAEGALLISTLAQPTQGGAPFEHTARLYATDFLTGADAASVTKLTIQVHNEDFLPHTLIAEVWSDSAGNPGSQLDTFDTVIVVPAFSPTAEFVAFDAGISLTANTIYWVVLRTGEDPSFRPRGNRMVVDITSGQDVNAGSLFSGVDATPFKIRQSAGDPFVTNSDFTPIFQLEGSVVPEPSTFLLFVNGIGLLGIVGLRRKSLALKAMPGFAAA